MTIPAFEDIIIPNDQTEARKASLEAISKLVGNVYTNKFVRSTVSGREDTITALKHCEKVASIETRMAEIKASLATGERPPAEKKDELNNELKALGNVRIAGRLTTPTRGNFVHLTDGMSKLQVYCNKKGPLALVKNDGKDTLDEENGWALWQLLDHGDFIGVEGYLFVTNTGEVSVHVERLQFLAKAMLPMPDKMHGIGDPEIKQRQRYVDLIGSSLAVEHEGLTTREVFETRAKIISSVRHYLEDHGYIEVETPMLTPKATGAAAKPFETHHNALDITLYARIAPELYLKRLVVGGFEKVYELNRNFRNEGISYKHNPEFTMLEFYCAYMDVNGMMDFCEELIRESVQKATSSLKVNYEGNEIDFSKFERIPMKHAIIRHLPKVDSYNVDESWFDDREKLGLLHWVAITTTLKVGNVGEEAKPMSPDEVWKLGLQGFESAKSRNEWESMNSLVTIFDLVVEEKLIQPTFIIDYPKSISPLSKASPDNPSVAERFELFINGMEVANGFSELNDPREQYERFVDQTKQREGGDEEAMILDEDYIRALSYSMPPAAGIGIGIDRLVMLLTNKHSIRDVILFPHMRPERNSATEDTDSA